MLLKNYKRCLSFALALALVLSLAPVSALAAEEDPSVQASPYIAADLSETAEEAIISTESSELPSEPEEANSAAVEEIQTRINAVLTQYGITAESSDQEIGDAIILKDGDTIKETMEKMTAIEEAALALSEDEFLQLDTELYGRFCSIMEQIFQPATLATTTTVLEGQVSITDTANKNTVSGSTVTIKATGNLFGSQTNTVTITNKSENVAELSFNYSVSKASAFTIDGSSAAASGTYSKLLDPDSSITIVLKSNSGLSNLTATLTLQNFSLTVAANSSKVIFEYDTNLGSVTVDSNAVSSGEEKNVPLSGVELAATAKSGATFYGWINEDGLILSTSTTYTLTPASDMTVNAVFLNASSAPHFYVGAAAQKSESVGIPILYPITISYYQVNGTYLFDDLNDATAFANSTNNKYVVLANSGTLPADNYSIPAGVTLLIPFDSANTLYTTKAQSDGTYVTPTAFRTLTLSNGVNLTVNGAISISAKTRYAQGAKTDGGSPSGPVGFINMLGSSNITVNDGGALYVYGFITGSGRVTAKSGATVYECFQFMDCRGGSQMTDMQHDVFPLSQYYVQNIEVPLRIEAGATENTFTTVYMSNSEFPAEACFIGPEAGMFRMTDGYVEKYYDGSTDRLIVDMSGDGNLASIKLKVGRTDVDSADYDLAINSNITVNIKSGSEATIQQDMVLLPGSEIIVEKDADCILGSGKQIFVYDADTWGNYCFSNVSKPLAPLTYAPSKTYTRTEADLVDARVVVDGYVDVSAGYAYTTYKDDEGIYGANICSTGTGVIKTKGERESNVTHNYQLDQTNATYATIPVEPIKLQNADGSYVETAEKGAGTYTYLNGFWHKGTSCDGGTATCTKKAVCSTCGQEYGELLPHIDGDPVVEYAMLPTYKTEGSYTSTVSCTNCGKEIRTETLTAPKVVQQAAIAASADSEIILDVKFWLPEEFENDTKATVTVTFRDEEPRTYAVNELAVDNNRYVITQSIASGEMTCPVDITFRSGDGTVVKARSGNAISDSLSKSVVDYAKLVLENGTDLQKTLITNLLTYGGYSQVKFGVDADNPAYKLLEEKGIDVPDVANTAISVTESDTVTAVSTITGSITGLTVSEKNQAYLDSAIYFRLYFTLTEGSTEDYSVSYRVPVGNRDTVATSLKIEPDTENNRYYVDIPDIPSGYLDYPYKVTFSKGSETLTVQTSVLAYLKRLVDNGAATTDEKNLAKAMYLYNQAANTFFNK